MDGFDNKIKSAFFREGLFSKRQAGMSETVGELPGALG